MITRPKLVVADEPVSALDVSIQSQILNLMKDLQDQFKLTYLFISHNLSVIRHVSDRIGVMYLGRLVEIAPKAELYTNICHPYTEALLSAAPNLNPRVKAERILLKVIFQARLIHPAVALFIPVAINVWKSVKQNVLNCGKSDPGIWWLVTYKLYRFQ